MYDDPTIDANGYSLRVLEVVRGRANREISADEAIAYAGMGLMLDETIRRDGGSLDQATVQHFLDTAEVRLMEAFDYLRENGEIS